MQWCKCKRGPIRSHLGEEGFCLFCFEEMQRSAMAQPMFGLDRKDEVRLRGIRIDAPSVPFHEAVALGMNMSLMQGTGERVLPNGHTLRVVR